MLIYKGDRAKFPTLKVGIFMIINIFLTAAPKYTPSPPVFNIMDIATFGSNNYVNWVCNSLVPTPHHAYLLETNIFKTLRKSVDHVPKMIVRDLTNVIPVSCILSSHLHWAVLCGFSLSVRPRVASVNVWISAATNSFIMKLLWIYKTSDICCNHRLVFSFDPNCTRDSMILLLMARFLSSLCCISLLDQLGIFAHF